MKEYESAGIAKGKQKHSIVKSLYIKTSNGLAKIQYHCSYQFSIGCHTIKVNLKFSCPYMLIYANLTVHHNAKLKE